ncbi:MAG: short-chain fatty acyl-CoA regulator family protein [Blastomonas sp.]
MAERKILAGPAVRRLRRAAGMTQVAFAQAVEISPSYLNLIERNQRPLSAAVMLRLAERFDFDPRELERDAPGGGMDALRRRLADPLFADLGIDRTEMEEWVAAAPATVEAFARAYERMSEGGGAGGGAQVTPVTLVRREIERWRNHFADLDAAAEELAEELRLVSGDLYTSIADRLRTRHQLSIRVLPDAVLPGKLRRLDMHARQLQLSEMLDSASRTFQAAYLLVQLEYRNEVMALVSGAGFDNRTADRLFQRHLTSYAAAAIMMPYGRFLRACDQTGYDILVLQRRFGAGFEQVAHRLTTLQRVGSRGLPFFMLRIDRAGQISKRYAGASQSLLADAEQSCPLWRIHHAFAQPGQTMVDLVAFEEDQPWLTIARTVQGAAYGAGGKTAEFVVALGIAASHAQSLIYARGVSLELERATPIGPGCAACRRAECLQRSKPPRGITLQFNERERGLTPFEFQRN